MRQFVTQSKTKKSIRLNIKHILLIRLFFHKMTQFSQGRMKFDENGWIKRITAP